MTDAIILRVPLGTMVEFPSFIKEFFDHFSANFKFKIEPYFKLRRRAKTRVCDIVRDAEKLSDR